MTDLAAIVGALEREHRINLPAHFLIAADHPARLECPTCALLADTPSVGPLRAALRDMTGAYHQERSHAGSWDECQRPRCQNARLALEGRGPFALLPTQASDSPEKT